MTRLDSALSWLLIVPCTVAAFVFAAFVFAEPASAESEAASSTVGNEWQPMNRSMVDLLLDGYHLVSVVASSPRTQVYYLQKPGTVVKCDEGQTLMDVPPPPAIPSQLNGGVGGDMPPMMTFVPSGVSPKLRVEIACRLLVRSTVARASNASK